jgi:pseudouridine-5'-phosphate glycosidase
VEALETLGVPVLGWGTDRFPRFHVPTSDLAVDARVDHGQQVATIARRHWDLAGGGLMVTAPVPEEGAVDPVALESWISQAQEAANQAGVVGRAGPELRWFLPAGQSVFSRE